MTWFKVDDQFPRHPKVMRAGSDAAWLFVAGGCYCAQYLTDGMIPKDAVAGLTALRGPLKLAQRLVDVDLWHDRGEAFEVHDYLVYNPTREKVIADRAAALERRKNGGKRSANVRANGAQSSGVPSPAPVPDVPSEHDRGFPPQDFAPTDEHRAFALEHALDLDRERDHWIIDCQAKGRTYKRLNAGFSTWLHQAVNFGRGGKPAMTFGQSEPVERVRCKACADTGHYFDTAGFFVECDHGKVTA